MPGILEVPVKESKNNAGPAMLGTLKKLMTEMSSGNFSSGQPLKESVLAKKYGFSRNAVREALNQIVGWGLVEYIPYKGYQIKKFNINNLLQWDELREALEPVAARRLAKKCPPDVLSKLKKYCEDIEAAYDNMDKEAIRQADFNFHSCVIKYCGNECFSQVQIISNLAAVFYFGKSIIKASHIIQDLSDIKNNIESSNNVEQFHKLYASTIAAHREMYEAIAAGDEVKAEEVFRLHARYQVERMEKYIELIGIA